jgi:hypothetical protein
MTETDVLACGEEAIISLSDALTRYRCNKRDGKTKVANPKLANKKRETARLMQVQSLTKGIAPLCAGLYLDYVQKTGKTTYNICDYNHIVVGPRGGELRQSMKGKIEECLRKAYGSQEFSKIHPDDCFFISDRSVDYYVKEAINIINARSSPGDQLAFIIVKTKRKQYNLGNSRRSIRTMKLIAPSSPEKRNPMVTGDKIWIRY